MNFAVRLKQLRKHLKMTQKEFSKSIHVSMSYVSMIETKTEVRHPSYNLIKAILSEYPQVNANWLLMDRGSMLKQDKEEPYQLSFLNDRELRELKIIKEKFPAEERDFIFRQMHNYFALTYKRLFG